jgi:hypothetical protein
VENTTRRQLNIVYQRVTRSAKPPTIKQTAVLTMILLLFSIGVPILYSNENILGGLFVIALPATFLLAPVVAAFAALIAANDARSEGYALQKITLLRPGAIVKGYSHAAFFRARLLVALVIGFLPALAGFPQIIIRQDDCHIFMSRSEYADVESPNLERLCAPDGDIHFILLPLGHLLATSTVSVIAIPDALFGVLLGLTLRRPIPSTVIAFVVPLFVNGIYLLCCKDVAVTRNGQTWML